MDGRHHFGGGGGLEEAEDCGVVGGGGNIALHRLPISGTSLELEAGEAADSPAFGSEEEVAI